MAKHYTAFLNVKPLSLRSAIWQGADKAHNQSLGRKLIKCKHLEERAANGKWCAGKANELLASHFSNSWKD